MKRHGSSLLHGFAFALTGAGTALLGSTLPATLVESHLPDSRGGLLLLAAWGGSTAGALLARGRLERSAALGLAGSAGALWGMAVAGPRLLPLLYLLYGLGLGATMTSVSLLRSRGLSELSAGVELNRLNLLWAIGACFAPLLALRSLRLLSVVALFRSAGAVFAAVALAILLLQEQVAGGTSSSRGPTPSQGMREMPLAPLRFCLFAAASVGLESAIGSWLTTYTERSTSTVGIAVSANAAFWAGLLVSRGVHSTGKLPWVQHRAVRLLHLLAIGLSQLLLLGHPTSHVLALAGLLCGLGLGPLYPLVLSLALPRYRSIAVFVLAGVGASLVPWLTGVLSTSLGSLRLGLLAPTMTFCLLLVLAFQMRSELSLTGARSLPGVG